MAGTAGPVDIAGTRAEMPVRPPVEPMLGRLARELPAGPYVYEPKWDGFRCLAFRDGLEVDLRSRNQRMLARYFPELVAGLRSLAADRFVLDGEIVALQSGGFDFSTLMARLHPAASRVARLAGGTPASFVAFDVLAAGEEDLRTRPFSERRDRLEALLEGALPPISLTPATESVEVAREWLERFQGAGIDGVMAKEAAAPYQSGMRAMVKVKRERTADCVVAGMRGTVDAEGRPVVSALLLGLYDDAGELHHVGVASAFATARRRELVDELEPLVVPLAGHPWQHGFLLGGGHLGRLRGTAGRWRPGEREQDWVPLAPERVCEVSYDQADTDRFRHPARFERWRPDRDPRSCTLAQLEVPAPELAGLQPSSGSRASQLRSRSRPTS
jgi:ATP-dependent DNA ligase